MRGPRARTDPAGHSRPALTLPVLTSGAARLWRVITSNENTELQSILDEDASRAKLRSADGRGPLFWAHEAGNEEAMKILIDAGYPLGLDTPNPVFTDYRDGRPATLRCTITART